MTIQKSRSAAGDDMFDWKAIVDLTQQWEAQEREKNCNRELQPSKVAGYIRIVPGHLYMQMRRIISSS